MQSILGESSLGDTKLQGSTPVDTTQDYTNMPDYAMQTNGNATGEALNVVGTTLNKASVVVTNVENIKNEESSQVMSTSHSSTVVSFDAAKYRASMRARYA